MVKQVTSYELRLISHELQVEKLKVWLEIQTCELKPTS